MQIPDTPPPPPFPLLVSSIISRWRVWMGGEVVKKTEQNPVMHAGGGVEVRGRGWEI